MRFLRFRSLAGLSALLVVLGAPLAAQQAPEIVTNGSATIRLRPDRAVIRLDVETIAPTAAAATAANAPLVARVDSALRRVGVAAGSMRSTAFYVMERLDPRDPSAPKAYRANTTLEVPVATLAAIGPTLGAAIEAGALFRQGIEYISDSLAVVRPRAIAQALAAARRDADALAAAAGGTLGTLITASTTGPSDFYGSGTIGGTSTGGYIPAVQMAVVPIERTVDVQVTVTGRWRMK